MSQKEVVPIEYKGKILYVQLESPKGMKNVTGGKKDPLPGVENLQDSIKTVSSIVMDSVKEMSAQKVSIEFGLELKAESGKLISYLVDGSATGSIKITLEWETQTHKG